MAPSAALYLLNNKRRSLSKLEESCGVEILVYADGRIKADHYELELITAKREDRRIVTPLGAERKADPSDSSQGKSTRSRGSSRSDGKSRRQKRGSSSRSRSRGSKGRDRSKPANIERDEKESKTSTAAKSEEAKSPDKIKENGDNQKTSNPAKTTENKSAQTTNSSPLEVS
jgi:hypothetical protein